MIKRLTSKIRSYDAAWPTMFDQEAARLTPIFGGALLELHHVGSTAVPGLSAKPEIDILAIVQSSHLLDDWTHGLAARGYRRGGDLSEHHHFFKRDAGGVRTHKIHVCHSGHKTAAEMLRFRDSLRTRPDERLCYDRLKRRLERDNSGGIKEYLDHKAPFIRMILDGGNICKADYPNTDG